MSEAQLRVAVPQRPAKAVPENGGEQEPSTFERVLECVRAAGLTPVIVDSVDDSLDDVHGIVVPGGGDVDPGRYGGRHIDAVYGVNQQQDEVDFWAVEQAIKRGLPLLGICRGAQVTNVVLGGTLYEDLPDWSQQHHNNIAQSTGSAMFVTHEVSIDPDSIIGQAFGGVNRADIQSAHHQCVRILGEGLRVTARAGDGIVEAFEGDEGREGWVLGVQWHPEVEPKNGLQKRGPFEALAAAVRERVFARGDVSVC